jgi:hypothetical protein
VPAESLQHRLVQAHQVVERPHLPAVGVPGDLQVDAVRHGPGDLLRLVGQQQHRQVRVGAGQRGRVVGVVARHAGAGRGPVVHPGDDQLGAVAGDDHVPVVQGLPAERGHVVDPALGAAEVLVVAGHVHPGQPGLHVAERGGLLAALAHLAVGDVAGVRHDVGAERVDHLDHAARPAGPVDRPVVRVGQQHHPQPVEAGAQAGNGDVDAAYPGHAHRFGVPPEEQDQRDQRDHRRDDPGARRVVDPGQSQYGAQHVAQDRPDEQHPDHAQRDVGDPGGPVLVAGAVPAEHQHRERDQREREEHRAGHEDRPRPLVAGPDQGPPGHREEQSEDGRDGQREPRRPSRTPAWFRLDRFTH